MSKQTFTPGPWKAHRTTHARSGLPEFEIHWSDDGECVAEIVHGEPDALLIAAAPDLLVALQTAEMAMLGYTVRNPVLNKALMDARTAISKATGGTA